MVTKLDRPVRRELRIGEKPYVITISHDRLRVALKGRRKGRELFWEDLVGDDGAAALSSPAANDDDTDSSPTAA
jgi:hypothetical protein